jgi:large subunit ribosomal protein L15
MQLHEIKKVSVPNKKRQRVGRGPGSGQGVTSGKGQKGQNSRSGVSHLATFEGGTMPLYRRLPKRGFNNTRFRAHWLGVNVETLNKFKDGDEVSLATLKASNIIKVPKSKPCRLKILGHGDLTVKNLIIKAHKISDTAKEKIEKANAKLEIITIKKFRRPKRTPRRQS